MTCDTRVAEVIDGKAFAERLRARVADLASGFERAAGRKAGLAVVLVGEDPASEVYVRSKGKATIACGMESFEHRLPAATEQAALLDLVERLNADPRVDGILVQLPLPAHIDANQVIAAIDPDKDVDGFHVINAGRLATGLDGFVPCTPLGCLMLLKDRLGDLTGLEAVVIGRSNIVGRTRDLPGVVRRADIVIAAVGRPEMVRADWIKPGACVIDVGINRLPAPEPGGKGRLVGDVAFAEVSEVAGAITPVPGGVGPMTIAVLLRNTLVAAHRRAGLALAADAL
jgi:methylenetetrahydrofolate dehydrogenase (NADP+) / methenyltetrahydrofolate cyclohydrolase